MAQITCNNGHPDNSTSNPSGKALIVEEVSFVYDTGGSAGDNYMYIYGCGQFMTAIESDNIVDSRSVELDNGYYVRSQTAITTICGTGNYAAEFVGYFVLANQVPAATSAAQAAPAPVKKRSADVVALTAPP